MSPAPRSRLVACALVPLLALQGAGLPQMARADAPDAPPTAEPPVAASSTEAGPEPIACRRFRASLAHDPPHSSSGTKTALVVGGMGAVFGGMVLTGQGDERSCRDCYGPRVNGTQVAGLVLAGVGLAMTVVGLAAGHWSDPRVTAADRCDALIALHCPSPMEEGACRTTLARACADGDLAACWALAPTGRPPRVRGATVTGGVTAGCAAPEGTQLPTCALDRSLEASRPQAP